MKTKIFSIVLMMTVICLAGCATITPGSDTSSGKEPTMDRSLESGVHEIGGVIVGGSDQTPQGLMDAPRTFIYQVKLDSGEQINLTYTAFPPTPAGQKSVYRLTFFEGTINPGNYIQARGTYDADTKTLTVAEDGDFIETFAQKP